MTRPPTFLPPSVYDQAKRNGIDLTGCRRQEPLPPMPDPDEYLDKLRAMSSDEIKALQLGNFLDQQPRMSSDTLRQFTQRMMAEGAAYVLYRPGEPPRLVRPAYSPYDDNGKFVP